MYKEKLITTSRHGCDCDSTLAVYWLYTGCRQLTTHTDATPSLRHSVTTEGCIHVHRNRHHGGGAAVTTAADHESGGTTTTTTITITAAAAAAAAAASCNVLCILQGGLEGCPWVVVVVVAAAAAATGRLIDVVHVASLSLVQQRGLDGGAWLRVRGLCKQCGHGRIVDVAAVNTTSRRAATAAIHYRVMRTATQGTGATPAAPPPLSLSLPGAPLVLVLLLLVLLL